MKNLKMKKYEELNSNQKKAVLLKYLEDPMHSLIKVRMKDKPLQAIEIWNDEEYFLVIVDAKVLSSLNWNLYTEDGNEDMFDDTDFPNSDVYDDLDDNGYDTYA